MITSNEPGYYVEGAYGIRHENLVVCKKAEQNEYGQFFHWSVIEILGSGAQAGPRSAKVAARPLHSESVSSFWKVPVRWLNRAAR